MFELSAAPVIAFQDLAIDGPLQNDGAVSFTVERGRIGVSVPALLAGRLRIPSAHFEGVAVTVTHRRREFTAGQIPGAATGIASIGMRPVFGDLTIERARITVDVAASGETFLLEIDRFALSGEAKGPAAEIHAEGRIQGHVFELDGKFVQPIHAFMGEAPIPVDLQLASDLIDATPVGDVTPSKVGAVLDIAVEVIAYDVRDLTELLGPAFAVGGLAKVSGRLEGPIDAPRARHVRAQVILENGSNIELTGTISDIRSRTGLDLAGVVEIAPDVCRWRDAPAWLPPLSLCHVEARIEGDLRRLSIRNIEAHIESGDKTTATLHADAVLVGSRHGLVMESATVEVAVDIADIRGHAALSRIELPDIGKIEARGTLSITPDGQVTVADGSAVAVDSPGLTSRLSGRIGRMVSTPERLKLALDLDLDMTGTVPRGAEFASAFGATMPFLARLDYALHLTGDRKKLALTDIDLRAETDQAATLRATGRVGAIDISGVAPTAGDLDIRLTATSPSTTWIADWLGVGAPELGAIKASARATGALSSLQLENIDLLGNSPGRMQTRVRGKIGHIGLKPGAFSVGQIDVSVESEIQTNAALVAVTGFDVPLVESLRAGARLTGDFETLTANAIKVSGHGDAGLTFQAEGRVADVLARQGVDLGVAGGIDPSRYVGAGTAGSLGRVEGAGRLIDQDGSLGLEAITVAVTGSDLWSVSATGQIDDIRRSDEIELRARVEIPNPSALMLAIGHDPWPLRRTTFDGTLGGSTGALQAVGTLSVGTTVFKGTMSGIISTDKPKLKGVLFSERVDFADFGLLDAEPVAPAIAPSESENSKSDPIFDADPIPFGVLRLADIDLTVRFEEIRGQHSDIDQLSGSLHLEDGVLDFDPLTFKFVGGDLATRVRIAADRTPPSIRVIADATDLDLGSSLRTIGAEVPVDGTLDLVLDVTARGDTPQGLARTLAGRMDAVMAEGQIRVGFFDLIGVDLLKRHAARHNC